jgi:hypothetical protein
MIVPKTFLPPGDSSVIFGAFHRQGRFVAEADARVPGNRVDKMLHNDPNVITDFTMTGATGFLRRTRASRLRSFKPAAERKRYWSGHRGDDGQAQQDFPV